MKSCSGEKRERLALEIGGDMISELLCFFRQLKFAKLLDHLDAYSNYSSVICGLQLSLIATEWLMPNILMCT